MRITKLFKLRRKFGNAFKLPVNDEFTFLTKDRVLLQYDMMLEELNEYKRDSLSDYPKSGKIADALIDMQEILWGMMDEQGILRKMPKLYIECNRSNMSKLDENGEPLINGKNGVLVNNKPIGKVIKSKNFSEPDFEKVLYNNTFWEEFKSIFRRDFNYN